MLSLCSIAHAYTGQHKSDVYSIYDSYIVFIYTALTMAHGVMRAHGNVDPGCNRINMVNIAGTGPGGGGYVPTTTIFLTFPHIITILTPQ
jgi:hypothetical protein